MGIKSKTVNLNSIVIEKIKLKYYVGIEYVSEWGNFNSSLWSHIIDDIFDASITYNEFKRIFKTYNGKIDKNSKIYFNSQEEANIFKEFLESILIINKITE